MSGTVGSGGMRSRPLPWLAGGCACVLVAALGLEYHSSVKRETRLAHSLSAAAAAAATTGAAGGGGQPGPAGRPTLFTPAGTLEDWSRFALERPLFSRSRRPVTTTTAGPRQPRLAGIVVGPRDARAIFAGDNGARGVVAAVGQQAGDWKVLAISAKGVEVSGPNGTHTLQPARDPTGNTGGSGGAPAVPEHPSILDLLRSRTLTLPFGQPPTGGPFINGGAPR